MELEEIPYFLLISCYDNRFWVIFGDYSDYHVHNYCSYPVVGKGIFYIKELISNHKDLVKKLNKEIHG